MDVEIKKIIEISREAGKIILDIYQREFKIEYKESSSFKSGFSPLTEADTVANSLIERRLKEIYPEIPFLSEEGIKVPYEERKNWKRYWLVDPLDGTKSFIKKTGEFTVNIALIEKGKPILGVVYVPVKDVYYYADEKGAFKKEGINDPIKLPINNHRENLVIVASKSHLSDETRDFIESIKKEKEIKLISIGSSLKLCLVAEGEADIYPRLGPTSEWDTAAAHAVVNGAKKKVYEYNTEKELIYNKENILNPWFIVR